MYSVRFFLRRFVAVVFIVVLPSIVTAQPPAGETQKGSTETIVTLPEDGTLLGSEPGNPPDNPVLPPPDPEEPDPDASGNCGPDTKYQCVKRADGSSFCSCCPEETPPSCVGSGATETCSCATCLVPVRTAKGNSDYHGEDIFHGTSKDLSCLDEILDKFGSDGRQAKGDSKDIDERVVKYFEDTFERVADKGKDNWYAWNKYFGDIPGNCEGGKGYKCNDIVIMTEDCKRADLTQPFAICGWLDARYIPSPISLIWEAGTDIMNVHAVTSFPLDPGLRDRYYVWRASAKTPLLVYDPEHQGSVTSGQQLFGTWTFGGKRSAGLAEGSVMPQPWRDGYEALASLDRNKDGLVAEEELEPLALWFDENSDGISQEGEVRPIRSEGVEALYYQGTYKNELSGNIHAPLGFIRRVGNRYQQGESVDWFSSTYRSKIEAELDMRAKLIPDQNEQASAGAGVAPRDVNGLWRWQATRYYGGEKPSGLFIFDGIEQTVTGRAIVEAPLAANPQGFKSVISGSTVQGERTVTPEGTVQLTFVVTTAEGRKTVSVAELSADGRTMHGRSSSEIEVNRSSGEPSAYEYHWIAERP